MANVCMLLSGLFEWGLNKGAYIFFLGRFITGHFDESSCIIGGDLREP